MPANDMLEKPGETTSGFSEPAGLEVRRFMGALALAILIYPAMLWDVGTSCASLATSGPDSEGRWHPMWPR